MRVAFALVTLAMLLTVAVPADAGGPEPQCMPVYREYNVGPVTVIQRDSCTYEVHFDEGPTSMQAGEPNCYYIYNEWEAGPVKVIQRNSCTYEVYAFGEPILK